MFSKSEIRMLGLTLLCVIIGYASQKISRQLVTQYDPLNDSSTLPPDSSSTPDKMQDSTFSAERDSAGSGIQAASSPQEAGGFPVNINTAEERELVRVKGIGPATARKIVQYRVANGLFQSLSELTRIKGIGPKKLKKMAPFLTL